MEDVIDLGEVRAQQEQQAMLQKLEDDLNALAANNRERVQQLREAGWPIEPWEMLALQVSTILEVTGVGSTPEYAVRFEKAVEQLCDEREAERASKEAINFPNLAEELELPFGGAS